MTAFVVVQGLHCCEPKVGLPPFVTYLKDAVVDSLRFSHGTFTQISQIYFHFP